MFSPHFEPCPCVFACSGVQPCPWKERIKAALEAEKRKEREREEEAVSNGACCFFGCPEGMTYLLTSRAKQALFEGLRMFKEGKVHTKKLYLFGQQTQTQGCLWISILDCFWCFGFVWDLWSCSRLLQERMKAALEAERRKEREREEEAFTCFYYWQCMVCKYCIYQSTVLFMSLHEVCTCFECFGYFKISSCSPFLQERIKAAIEADKKKEREREQQAAAIGIVWQWGNHPW